MATNTVQKEISLKRRILSGGVVLLGLMACLALVTWVQSKVVFSGKPALFGLLVIILYAGFGILQNFISNKLFPIKNSNPIKHNVIKLTIFAIIMFALPIGIYFLFVQVKLMPSFTNQAKLSDDYLILETYPKSVLIYSLIYQLLLAPFVEETLFRKILTNLSGKTIWVNYVLSFFLFALSHVGFPMSIGEILIFIIYGFISLILTATYLKTKNLAYPVVSHTAINLYMSIPTLIVLL